MRSLICLSAFVFFGLLVLPLMAADDVKPPAKDAAAKDAAPKDAAPKDAPAKDAPKKDEKKDPEEKKDKDWVKAGQMSGELVNINDSKKTIKVKLTTEIRTINQGEAQGLAQAEANLQRAIAGRDANGVRQAQQDIVTHTRNLYKLEKKTQEVEVPTLDDVKVRIPAPPVAYDDDGKIKRYTTEELRKLKGDPPLPGYPGEFNNLHSGQMVTITLMRKKDAKPPPPVKPDPLTGKPPAPEIDLTGDYVPHASLIVIVYENPAK
jgi:hypothetical protein